MRPSPGRPSKPEDIRRAAGPVPRKRRAALNPAQAKAATTLAGPVLVVAGAGTGKTLTLVHRLVELMKSGVPPESILLLTFTRRAAQEMIRRAAALLGNAPVRVGGGTFHSFASLTLRRYGSALGLDGGFTILDQADAFEILSTIRADLKLAGRERGFPRRNTIAAIISKSVNKKTGIETVLRDEYPHFLDEAQPLREIARRYRTYKEKRRFLDFDDLLVCLVRLLEKSAATRARVQERYRYVMVDEYQDTNVLQAQITELLAGKSQNLMVVGDDAQSIYAFRGACYHNLFEFQESFPKARRIVLEQNYRSSQPVLDVANALMGQMSRAFRKRLRSTRPGGDKPYLVEAEDEQEQAHFVASEVLEWREKKGLALADIAVLFRAGSHAFGLELELQSRGIPYVKYGGFKFLEAAHIKDVLAHLRVVANGAADDLSLTRVLMLCEGIGRVGALRIQKGIGDQPVGQALADHRTRGRSRQSLENLAKLLSALDDPTFTPARRLEMTIEHYTPTLKLRFDDWPRRVRDLEQLVTLCEKYRNMETMLTDLTLEPPTTSSGDNLAEGPDGDSLVLSTMHSAKGLEWKVVFVIQAVEGCIPMVFGDDAMEGEKLDEELRLLYVAVTRAREALYVVQPSSTARSWGWVEPSRFIEVIPEENFTSCRASHLLRGRSRATRKKKRVARL